MKLSKKQFIKRSVVLLILGALFFSVYQIYIIRYTPIPYFSDKKVRELSWAAKKGDTKKIDRLLREGVDINYRNKDNYTPLSWLFYYQRQRKSEKVKKGFKYLLKKGADPLIKPNKLWPVLHGTANYEDSTYLKMILENGVNVDAEVDGIYNKTALLQAISANRFENFKMLLDYGADVEWANELGNTPLIEGSGNGTWRFAYELLKRGANYTVKSNILKNDSKADIIRTLEGLRYWPSVATSYHGTDYRQKCVEFLREKGVEVHPWVPEDEKYVTENGKDVLYIKENDQWVKYEDSEKYKKQLAEEKTLKARIQNWIYEKFYE